MSKRRKRIESRSRQANWQQIQRAEGFCPKGDGNRLDRNPRTGKAYTLCPHHRELHNALMRQRRAAAK